MPESKEGHKDFLQDQEARKLRLKELMAAHQLLRDIPQQDLDEIGYRKDVIKNPDGTERVSLVDIVREQERHELKEQKEQGAPFGRITIEAEPGRIGRKIDRKTFNKLVDEYLIDASDIHFANQMWKKKEKEDPEALRQTSIGEMQVEILYGKNSHVSSLFKRAFEPSNETLEKIISELQLEGNEGYEDLVGYVFIDDGFSKTTDVATEVIEGEARELYWKYGNNDISSQEAEEIQNHFHQVRGKLADPDFYADNFQKVLHSEMALAFEEQGRKTLWETSKYLFISLLEEKEVLGQYIEEFKSAESSHDFTDKLSTALQEIKKELKNVKSKKSADRKEQIEKSEKIKTLQDATDLLQQVASYYDMPQYAADLYGRQLKDFIKQLTRGSTQEQKEFFILDGRPDAQLDKNPGRVSGDCTDGKPLPFDKPEIPLFNIKVFRGENQHMGNVYLLKTTLEGENVPVWHLEAIQIPASLKWDEFIDTMFKELLAEAAKKGVAGITVNEDGRHISNYDYIADAVLKYAEKSGSKMTNIDLPRYTGDQYSEMQSSGEVFLITK